jgi:Serine hydrolase (FSH1)
MLVCPSIKLEKPEFYPPFLVDGKAPHPRFEFCVAVSGFKLKDPLTEQLWAGGYSTPTLHVIGKTDVVVVEERSRALLEVSNDQRVEEHMGGECRVRGLV